MSVCFLENSEDFTHILFLICKRVIVSIVPRTEKFIAPNTVYKL